MFSHVMVGTRDLEKAKSFYNKVLGTLGFEGEPIHNVGPSGHSRLFYRRNGGISWSPSRSTAEPASAANGATVGFQCDSPEQVEAGTRRRRGGGDLVEDPPGLREGRSARCTSPISAIPTATSFARCTGRRAVRWRSSPRTSAHGGRQLVVKHASRATSTDMTFSIFLPPQAEEAASCRSSGICRASPAPMPTSPRRASIAPPAPSMD